MKNIDNIHRFWMLIVCLCFSPPWTKWFTLSGVVIVFLGVPLHVVWQNPIAFILGGVLLSLGVFIMAISLPQQMLSINSSKQMGMLPNVRVASYIIFAVACLFNSVLITAFYSLNQHQLVVNSFWVSSLLLSSILIANILACQKYRGAQALVFVCIWAVVPVYKWLIGIHWAILLSCLVCVWIAFYVHWKSWMPTKFHQNMFGMSQQQLHVVQRQRAAEFNMWLGQIFAVAAVNLYGSILLGRADGWKSKARTSLGIFIGLMLLLSICSMFVDKSKFKNFFFPAGQMNIYICYFSMANGLVMTFYRNINKLWLYHDGRRDAFFHTIEKNYFSWVLVMGIPIMLIHVAITYFLLDIHLYGHIVWMMAIYSLVTCSITFYLNLVIYQKTEGNMQWNMWLVMILLLASSIPVGIGSNMWVEHTAKIMQIAFCSIVGLAAVTLVLRSWVKNKWMSVDFVKVKP